jgi:aspartate kinase
MTLEIVTKFGGSSLANAEQIRKVEKIINSDNNRRYVVVSAPGTDKNSPYKITDILYNIFYNSRKSGKNTISNYKKIPLSQEELLKNIHDRYSSIASDLGTGIDLIKYFDKELQDLLKNKKTTVDDVVSRGENFHARLIARYLNARFVDAKDLIYIDNKNNPDNDKTMGSIKKLTILKDKKIIIPGFYGNTSANMKNAKIKTFARGGSDLTGALIAAGVNATVYENWTDQNGILCVDPRLFEDKREVEKIPVIEVMTFKECRELTYSGFSVLHDETVGSVRKRNIPINIRNTNNPSHKGTMITSKSDRRQTIVGIAGRDGFCTIDIEKYMMNKETGFGQGVLEIIAKRKINFEHMPSGIDDMSIIIEEKALEPFKDEIVNEIKKKFHPDNVKVTPDLALISIVGEGMFYQIGIAAKATGCLAKNKINIEIMNQGASESNIIIGVASKDYKKCIQLLYEEFLKH